MNYISTRDKSLKFNFKDIFLRGLAPGGGLFLPSKLKKYSKEDLKETTGQQFNEFVIFLEDNQVKVPLPKKISIDVPNNHLKYAITWYAISISIIFYYLYFRRKR